jgi:Asp-tRNA(Asn)/Glu-tRNA(Gln) amidotransferase A subunit family amidase
MPGRPPRLALCRTPHWDQATVEGKTALETAAARLGAAGAQIVESELPPECADISEIQRRHSAYEAPRNHAPELHRHAPLLSDDLLANGRIAEGRKLSLDDFREASRRAERARAVAREWAGGFDAILTLPAPGAAPRGLGDTGSAIFNGLWTMLYMPCLTLPAETTSEGLPVAIQLVGPRHGDHRLLEIGLWVERHLGAAQ